jgi:hypothetical protein
MLLLLLVVVLKRNNRSKREEGKKMRRFEGNFIKMIACLSFSIFSTLLHVKIVGITISFYDDLLDISFNTNEQMAR